MTLESVGMSVGRFHILEQLGEGGMATVYKAFDTRLEREVAIKFLRGERLESDKAIARFKREAKALAQLNHPHILTVHDYGEYNGVPYFVTEYIPGGTLKKYLGKPIQCRQAARMLAPIAHALEYAHQRGVLHRDIKPANILIAENRRPIISDFGIAKLLEIGMTIDPGSTPETGNLTLMGVGVGTPEYMAPEQASGKEINQRADIYALGVVFYEMVTGRKPFQADTPLAVLMKHANEPLPRPKEYLQDIPQNVEQSILKALNKDPENRFPDMGSFAAILDKIASGKYIHIPNPLRFHPPGWISKIGAGVIGAVMTMICLGLIMFFRDLTPGAPLQSKDSVTNIVSPTKVTDTSTIIETKTITATSIPILTSTPGLSLKTGSVPAAENGTWEVSVDQNEIHVWTSGPVCLAGICLKGGETRGSVVLMLPSDIPYQLTGLIPGENWHGEYFSPNPDQWQELADERIDAMQKKGNCTGDTSCNFIDVLVVSPDSIIKRYIVTKSKQIVYPITESEVDDPMAFLPRSIATIGTGALEWVFYSNGDAEFDKDHVSKEGPLHKQVVNGEDTDGCGEAIYPSSRIWFGSTMPAIITVNREEIGAYTGDGTGGHGFIIHWPVVAGDIICVITDAGAAFHIVIGPDIDIHYDSYCFRTDEC